MDTVHASPHNVATLRQRTQELENLIRNMGSLLTLCTTERVADDWVLRMGHALLKSSRGGRRVCLGGLGNEERWTRIKTRFREMNTALLRQAHAALEERNRLTLDVSQQSRLVRKTQP